MKAVGGSQVDEVNDDQSKSQVDEKNENINGSSMGDINEDQNKCHIDEINENTDRSSMDKINEDQNKCHIDEINGNTNRSSLDEINKDKNQSHIDEINENTDRSQIDEINEDDVHRDNQTHPGDDSALNQYMKLDKMVKLNPERIEYSDDTAQSVEVNIKNEISQWYGNKWAGLPRRLLVICVENSIQFAYQFSTIIFHHKYPNLRDVDDNVYWFYILALLRTFSVFMSTMSIISPIIDRMSILAFIHGGVPTAASIIIKCVQIISHLSISTLISFLSWII